MTLPDQHNSKDNETFEKAEDAYWASVIEARRAEGGYLSAEQSLSAVQILLAQ